MGLFHDINPSSDYVMGARPSLWAAALVTSVAGILFRPDAFFETEADTRAHIPTLRSGFYKPAENSARLWADEDRTTLTAVFSLGNCIEVTDGRQTQNGLVAVSVPRPQGRTHTGFMDKDALRPATPSECPPPRAFF